MAVKRGMYRVDLQGEQVISYSIHEAIASIAFSHVLVCSVEQKKA